MKQLLAACFLCTALSAQPLMAQSDTDISPELRTAVVRLLKVSGAENEILQQADTLVDEVLAPIKLVRTDLSKEIFVRIKGEVMETLKEEIGGEDSIYDILIPIYAKHYTLEEANALADFYESPLGQKTLTVTPVIAAESKPAYQAMSQRFLPIIAIELKQKME